MILTGAGISRESGLDTFRDPDGIWARVNVDDVATPHGFERNPMLVHSFCNARRRQLLSGSISPNQAHFALRTLQHSWRGDVTVITQNIDDLHERAGTSGVIHIHGELLKARCTRCLGEAPCLSDLSLDTMCPNCGARGNMRPSVVWFGEVPMYMDAVHRSLRKADLFIAVGTSGSVYPAAGFVELVRSTGGHTVELNLERSLGADLFDDAFYGPATKVVKEYVDGLLSYGELELWSQLIATLSSEDSGCRGPPRCAKLLPILKSTLSTPSRTNSAMMSSAFPERRTRLQPRLALYLLLIVLPTVPLSAQTQPQPATLRSLLLHELRTTHSEAEWFVPINVAVEGLTAEQANWQPPNGGHSAGQLAYHLLFWNRRNLNNFRGIKNDKFTGDNKKTFDNFDSQQWADVVHQLDQVMTDLEKLVATADDQQLQKWAGTIGNLCTHNAYHIGQIVYVRKLQGAWNPEKGVKS